MKNFLAMLLLISGLAAVATEPKVAQEEIVLPVIVIHKPTAMPRGSAIMMANSSLGKNATAAGQASEPEPAKNLLLPVHSSGEAE